MMPLAIFIAYPLAAFGVAVLLMALYGARRAPVVLNVAVLWSLYAVYEFLMYRRVLCSGECNIRVDLLLIYPLLVFATIWAVVQAIRFRPGTRR
jgi:hypothetical protein